MSDNLVGPSIAFVAIGVPVVVGLAVGVRRRLIGGWLWFTAAITAIGLPLAFVWPGSIALTTPWYRVYDRIVYNLAYPGVIMAGLGAWWLCALLLDRIGPAPGMSERAGRAVTAGRGAARRRRGARIRGAGHLVERARGSLHREWTGA